MSMYIVSLIASFITWRTSPDRNENIRIDYYQKVALFYEQRRTSQRILWLKVDPDAFVYYWLQN